MYISRNHVSANFITQILFYFIEFRRNQKREEKKKFFKFLNFLKIEYNMKNNTQMLCCCQITSRAII